MSDAKASNPRGFISGSCLKMIALVSMLIDHVGAIIIEKMLLNFNQLDGIMSQKAPAFYFAWMKDYETLYRVDEVLRGIGRIAFPIYCFLLVEGYFHTRNMKKYLLRLGIFALLSEIPFDFALFGTWMNGSHQNVFFTMFLGLLSMLLCETLSLRFANRPPAMKAVVVFGGVVLIGALAQVMECDYGFIGVMAIFLLYYAKAKLPGRSLFNQALIGAVSFFWELPAPVAFIPVLFYNGKRGLPIKYLFYLFYPVHLFLLGCICAYLGLKV